MFKLLDFLLFNMNPNCATEVTTPSGKFTFHKEMVSICEAKKFCAEKGEILAPVTNKADFDALLRVMQTGNNPSCPFHHGDIIQYATGLDVTPCGKGKQDRVFTNGVAWSNVFHGKWYSDLQDSWHSSCVFATVCNWDNRPAVNVFDGCYQVDYRFICLKETVPSNVSINGSCSSSFSQAISSGVSHKGNFVGGLSIACFSIAAVFLAFIATKYHKKYQAVEEKRDEMKK